MRELVRVVRPGGSVVLAAWTPRGLPGALEAHVETVAPPPDGVPPATSWGVQATAGARLAPALEDVQLRLRTVALRFAAPAGLFEALTAPAALTAAQREALRPAFDRLLASCNNATDGSAEIDARYLVASGRRPVSS